jgi:hypothetical protein
VNNAEILSMLANSYNISSWPSGAALKLSGTTFVVAVGTNLVRDVSNVLSLSTSNSVFTGQNTETQVSNPSGSTTTAKLSENIITAASLVYDDTALTTFDGKNTQFTANGYLSATISGNGDVSTGVTKVTFTFTGGGAGNVSGTDFVIHGTLVGSFTTPGVGL